jgi:hypothetical protein
VLAALLADVLCDAEPWRQALARVVCGCRPAVPLRALRHAVWLAADAGAPHAAAAAPRVMQLRTGPADPPDAFVLAAAAASFADEARALDGGIAQHRFVAHALLLLMDALPAAAVRACVPRLLPGIQVHIGSPAPQLRKLGMVRDACNLCVTPYGLCAHISVSFLERRLIWYP